MRHARAQALTILAEVVAALRDMPELRERSHGVFYRRSQSFAHFHEDPAGLFADLREGADFVRYPVNTAAQRRGFLAAVRATLTDPARG